MKHRKLRTHILAIFLILISISSASIISFNYVSGYRSIIRFAKANFLTINSHIQEKITCLLHAFERLPKISMLYYLENPGIQTENHPLIYYFLRMVQLHEHLYAFYAGSPDGSFIGVFNLPITGNADYFGKNNPAPHGAVYALIVLDKTDSEEIWSYYDADLRLISSETVPNRGYDPRVRPWYQGVLKTGKEYWTDVFVYDPTGDRGIAVANPVYDENHNLLAIIGADLSLRIFSDFLSKLQIGEFGRAVILDETGNVVLPVHSDDPITQRAIQIASAAFKLAEFKQSPDVIFKSEDQKYLAAVHPMPLTFGKNWQVVIIDPFHDLFKGLIQHQNEAVGISILILLAASALVIYFSHKISDPIVRLSLEVRKIQHLDLDSNQRIETSIAELLMMDASIASMRSALRSFGRYVPKEVVKQLVEHGQKIEIGGENKEVAIFFTDITDFTGIAETMSPEQVTSMLADYFSVLSDLILSNHGTIDKYMGDGIMAFWGAPEELPHPTETACYTALACQAGLKAFNQRQAEKGAPLLETRIGIGTGSAIVGNIGTEERMNYTALGDIVNTTSRFQALNTHYRTKIIIGEKTMRKAGPNFLSRAIDYVEIKGKRQKQTIYELIGLIDGPEAVRATEEQKELCSLFAKAYLEYHSGNKEKAKQLFVSIHEKFPEDFITKMYLDRL